MCSDYVMSRFVRGAVHSCCPYTPTLVHKMTSEGGGGMRVRHDPGTCGTGSVRPSTLQVSLNPRQSMYQRELKQSCRSYIYLEKQKNSNNRQHCASNHTCKAYIKIIDIAGLQLKWIRQEQRGWDACDREPHCEPHHPQ